jgi:hypothetical protein
MGPTGRTFKRRLKEDRRHYPSRTMKPIRPNFLKARHNYGNIGMPWT